MTVTSQDAKACPPAVGYRIDSTASRFTVRVFASGMLSALGHSPTLAIRDFTGDIGFNPAAPERATLKVKIRSDSLEVMDDIKSSDRREMQETTNRDVLQVDRYPVITFESTSTAVDLLRFKKWRSGWNICPTR